jgi:hypothetical protein
MPTPFFSFPSAGYGPISNEMAPSFWKRPERIKGASFTLVQLQRCLLTVSFGFGRQKKKFQGARKYQQKLMISCNSLRKFFGKESCNYRNIITRAGAAVKQKIHSAETALMVSGDCVKE